MFTTRNLNISHAKCTSHALTPINGKCTTHALTTINYFPVFTIKFVCQIGSLIIINNLLHTLRTREMQIKYNQLKNF